MIGQIVSHHPFEIGTVGRRERADASGYLPARQCDNRPSRADARLCQRIPDRLHRRSAVCAYLPAIVRRQWMLGKSNRLDSPAVLDKLSNLDGVGLDLNTHSSRKTKQGATSSQP